MLRRYLTAIALLFAAGLPVCAQEKKLPLLFEDDFEKGADRWQPADSKAWRITDLGGNKVFEQFQLSKVKTPHRSPFNYALVKDLIVGNFILEAKIKSTVKDYGHRDMCLFFGWQDPARHYYVHMAKAVDDRAHQIFIVNAKDRVKISTKTTKGVEWGDRWHQVKLVRTVSDGAIALYFDDMNTPIMTATDGTFTWGQVGVGTFDDTGMVDDVKVYGVRSEKK
ncbi:MAG: hypothetical protein U0744_18460 [Gemmataceae bacterium]